MMLGKKKKKTTRLAYEDHLWQQSIKMYGFPFDALSTAQQEELLGYLDDIAKPKWKTLTIHDDGTSCDVSNTGKIMGADKKMLKAYVSGAGYQTVWIRSAADPKVYYPRFVHRLVAEAFVPNPDNKPEVIHIDTNKFNCWYGNLKWVTQLENIQHGIDMDCRNTKFTEEQIREVCRMLENPDVVIRDVVKKTGVSVKTINRIRFDNGWYHIAKDYNIAVSERSPRYSPLSCKIRDLILEGKDNDEIKAELDMTGLSSDMTDRTILDRIWYVRSKLI